MEVIEGEIVTDTRTSDKDLHSEGYVKFGFIRGRQRWIRKDIRNVNMRELYRLNKKKTKDLSEKDLVLNIEKVYNNLNETQKRLFWGLIDEIIGQ